MGNENTRLSPNRICIWEGIRYNVSKHALEALGIISPFGYGPLTQHLCGTLLRSYYEMKVEKRLRDNLRYGEDLF